MRLLPAVLMAFLLITGCTKESANKPPEIVLLVAEPDTVRISDTVACTCLATDADGDPLTYWWTSTEGDFVNGAIGSSIHWKAPTYIGDFLITANVSDGEEAVTGELKIVVPLYPLQEGRDFANTHFNEDAYRQYEFSLAQNPAHGDSGAFHGSFDDWTEISWDVKIHYLPAGGFTHELPTQAERLSNDSFDVVYYEVIGYYIHQFGFGWDDGVGDDPGTPFFDGNSPNAEYYTSTWLRPR